MDTIQIVSWILTRKCNLKCSYCSVTRNYKGIPDEYPKMNHYFKNEMSTEYVIDILGRLKLHNPDCFHIFYGGEPLLRTDLPEIIQFCNDNDIHYTIITNNSDEVQPMLDHLLSNTSHITGLTSSVDPLVVTSDSNGDRYKKCIAGFNRLVEYKGIIKDLVAEITVDNRNIEHLYDLVAMLTNMGINSDITFIDIAKTPYYDFSNVTDISMLVENNDIVKHEIQRIIDDRLDVHMAATLLPIIIKDLPSEMDCELEKDVHNMTVDADGTVRLCLRLRGVSTPRISADSYIFKNGRLNPMLKENITKDKSKYCRGCNWTCIRMSQLLSKQSDNVGSLVHAEKRG